MIDIIGAFIIINMFYVGTMVETVVETPAKFWVLSPFPLKNKDL